MGGGGVHRHFRAAQLQGAPARQAGDRIHGAGRGGKRGTFPDVQQNAVQGGAVAQRQGGVRSHSSEGQRAVTGDGHISHMAAGLLAGEDQLGAAAQVQGSSTRAGGQVFHRRHAGGAVIPAAQRDVSPGELQRSEAVARTVQDNVPFRGAQHGVISGEAAFHGEGFRSFLDKVHMVPADGAAVAVASGVHVLDQVHHGMVGGSVRRRIRHHQSAIAADQVADFQAVSVPGGFRSTVQAYIERGSVDAHGLVGIQGGVVADVGVVHGQRSRRQHQPYAVGGIPVGGEQVQDALVAEVDGRVGGGERQAVRINDALPGCSARGKAAGIQFQRHRLSRHVQAAGDAGEPGVVFHDDGADHGAGQTAQIDGVQGALRSGGSGHFHVSGGFSSRVCQASLRDQDGVGRILGGQVKNPVVDGDPPGPQGVGPREGDGARSGERSGTGEPGVAGRQRYIPRGVDDQGTGSGEGPGPGAPVTQPRRSAARNGEGAQEGVRSGELQRSGVYGYRAAGRAADDAAVGEVAGKGQRGVVLDVNAVPQLGHIGGVHRNCAAVHLELSVQIDAAREGDVAPALGGERRSAQIAAEGEVLGGEYLVARKDDVIGKGAPGRAVPFRTDIGVRQVHGAVCSHGHVVQLEVTGCHGQGSLECRAHVQDIGSVAGSQAHGNGAGAGGIQVQRRVVIGAADRQHGAGGQFHGFSVGQGLGGGSRHIFTQDQGAVRPRHVVCGERRGKGAGRQIEAPALKVDHAHARLDVSRSQRERATRNGDSPGTEGVGHLGHQLALLEGDGSRPARIVQVQGKLAFAALGQRALRNFSGAV